jgi:hypothetical protein
VIGGATPEASAADVAAKLGEPTGGAGAGAGAGAGRGGSISAQRQAMMDQADPATKHLMRQMMATEGGGAPTLEALFNRTAEVRKKFPDYSLKEELNSGFYNPIKKGIAQQRVIGAKEQAEQDKTISKVLGGSNIIQGRTNQGMKGDPDWDAPGNVPAPGSTDYYNYWVGRRRGRDFSRSEAARFAESQQEQEKADLTKVAASADVDRAMVDKRSVKTVKVDATGKVNVNVASGQGDVTLGSEKLFKPTSPERSTQMTAAESGPKAPSFNERWSQVGGGTETAKAGM